MHKNEEKDIRRCIESMKKAAGEIILADTGSSDGTVDIVSSLGAKKRYYKRNSNLLKKNSQMLN